ncbi:MAG: acyltransferase [Hyphomonadaceae bacterium]
MPTTVSSSFQRRYDLDWLRIGAIALLIVTHVNYVFVSWHWRVHSENGGLFGDLVFETLAPWRMALVFFIGGAATRFMLDKLDLGAFLQNRFLRLFVPFVFAMIVLIPPINYIALGSAHQHSYLYYLTHDFIHAHKVYGVWFPDFLHAWFLIYVFCYAVAAGLAWRLAHKHFARAEQLAGQMPVELAVLVAATAFFVSSGLLEPVFGQSQALIDDPTAHVRSITPFLLGLLLVRQAGFWTSLRAARRWLYPLAGILLSLSLGFVLLGDSRGIPHGLHKVLEAVDSLYGAVMLFAVLAFASSALNHKGPGLSQSYLSDAIMPVYLLHNLILPVVAKVVLLARYPLWIEYPLVLLLVAAISMAIYHVAVRPFDPVRFLFGMKLKGKTRTPSPSAPSGTGHLAG